MDITFIIFIAGMSIAGFLMMGLDKAKAKLDAWRIPEKNLLLVAICGGSLGVWLGMRIFRHKTKHWYFKYGVPAIFFIELVFLAFLYTK